VAAVSPRRSDLSLASSFLIGVAGRNLCAKLTRMLEAVATADASGRSKFNRRWQLKTHCLLDRDLTSITVWRSFSIMIERSSQARMGRGWPAVQD
jgi:hypothetical protein